MERKHRGSFRVNPNSELLQLRRHTSHHRVRWKTVVSYVMKIPNAVIPSERPCLWTASRGTPIVGGASAIKILQLAHALSRGLASGWQFVGPTPPARPPPAPSLFSAARGLCRQLVRARSGRRPWPSPCRHGLPRPPSTPHRCDG